MARRGAPQPNALVAAATRVRLADPKVADKQAARRQDWQTEAWAFFDEVPEIKESVRYRGNQLAKVRLYVAVANPEDPDGDPVPVTDDASGVPPQVAAAATAELERLRSAVGGRAEILRMLDMNLEVAGECYLVGLGQRDEQVRQRDGTVQTVTRPEDWTIRSVAEVDVKLGAYFVKKAPTDPQPYQLDPELDTIIRIWTRHPQWQDQADSAMRGLLGECRTLQVLSQQVLAQAMRSVSAGFWTMPNELSFGPADPTQADSEGNSTGDPLLDAMEQVLVRPISDPSDPSTVQPGLLRGPAEYLKPDVLRRIKFYDPEVNQGLEEGIKARIERIARGLNLPVEKVMGHQQTTYANAAQVDEDEYNDYLRPSVDVATDALTWAFLHPQLEENPTVAPEWVPQLFVAADPAGLIAQPDTEGNANDAWDRNAISNATYRKAKGYSEDDAPEPDEVLQRAGLRRGILTADLTLALLKLLGVPLDVQPTPGSAQPAPDAAAQAALLQALVTASALAAPANGNGHAARPYPDAIPAAARRQGPDYGARLAGIDRELRTRLVVASNDGMGRALERAANVLRSKANGTQYRAALRNVPNREVYAHLGQRLVADVLGDTDPLAGAWDELEQQFLAWGANAQAEALDVAGRVAAGFATSVRTTLQLRQADDLATAWTWMRDALTSLAHARMFDPSPAGPDLGEFDPTLRVPTGLVRVAVARAGGAAGLVTNGEGSAWVALTDAGTRPAGGIGTGQLLGDAMRDSGALVEAYRWVYGPAYRQRPFLPHQQLDGLVFRNFDDAELANRDSFPEAAYYLPGDHAGCICDFEPIIVPADEVS